MARRPCPQGNYRSPAIAYHPVSRFTLKGSEGSANLPVIKRAGEEVKEALRPPEVKQGKRGFRRVGGSKRERQVVLGDGP